MPPELLDRIFPSHRLHHGVSLHDSQHNHAGQGGLLPYIADKDKGLLAFFTKKSALPPANKKSLGAEMAYSTKRGLLTASQNHGPSKPSKAYLAVIAQIILVLLIIAAFFYNIFPARSDINFGVVDWRFSLKIGLLFTLTLNLGAKFINILGLSPNPEAHKSKTNPWLFGLLIGFIGVCIAEFFIISPSGLSNVIFQTEVLFCLIAIASLGTMVGSIFLMILGRTNQIRTINQGAITGGFAGAACALIYAFYGVNDSPLFLLFWYVPAVLWNVVFFAWICSIAHFNFEPTES